MLVPKVVSKRGSKVTGVANVVEFSAPIKGIDFDPPSDILTDDVLIFPQGLP